MKIGPMMPLSKIAAHLGECRGLVATSFTAKAVWVSPDIVHQHFPASLTGYTEGLTSLTHSVFQTLSLLTSLDARFSVEALHGPILLKVVHPVLNSAFGWSLFTFKLMHETVLDFLKQACLVVKFNTVYSLSQLPLGSWCTHGC